MLDPEKTVMTTKGLMSKAELECKTGAYDDDNEHTEWVEYWHEGELVHRSVHVHLKQALFAADGMVTNFS